MNTNTLQHIQLSDTATTNGTGFCGQERALWQQTHQMGSGHTGIKKYSMPTVKIY